MSPIPVGAAVFELLGDSSDFQAAMNEASKRLEPLGQKFEKLGRDLDQTGKRMSKSFAELAPTFTKLGSVFTRFVSVPLLGVGAGATAAAVKMDTLERALVAVAGTSEEAERQMERLKEVAKLPGLGLAEAVQGSVRLQAVGVEAERAERALKAFGNAIATTGGGKSELDRVTVQIGQLSAKGRILAQDLRPIIEAAPAVGKALRDAFGTVSPEEIEALGLSTDQFLDRLIAQLEKLPAVTGGPRNAFENLQDSLLRAGAAIGDVTLPAITKLTEGLAGWLEKIAEAHPRTLTFGVALGGIGIAAGPALIALGKLPALVDGAVKGFRALQVAMIGVNAALGPAGWLALGIGAVGAGLAVWATRQREVNQELAKIPQVATIAQLEAALADAEDRLERFGRSAQTSAGHLRDNFQRKANEARAEVIRLRTAIDELRQGMAVPLPALTVTVQGAQAAQEAAEAVASAVRSIPAIPERQAPFLDAAQVNAAAAGMGQVAIQVGEVSAQVRRIGEEAAPALDALRDRLGDVALAGLDAFADLATGSRNAIKDFVNDALRQLSRLAVKLAAFRALDVVFPGSGFVAQLGASIGASFTGRASGGSVIASHPYIVGERGPELFVPRSAGTVVSNAALTGADMARAFDLSRFPPAQNPLAATRDHDWQQFIQESMNVAVRERGFRP